MTMFADVVDPTVAVTCYQMSETVRHVVNPHHPDVGVEVLYGETTISELADVDVIGVAVGLPPMIMAMFEDLATGDMSSAVWN